MDHLKKVITSDQFQQLNDDILRGMDINKQEYCNADNHTLQEAKDRLHALLTTVLGVPVPRIRRGTVIKLVISNVITILNHAHT